MTRARGFALALLLAGAGVDAHVGSPEILYEGAAGPHHVLVRILPPDVVPGTAQITVRAVSDGVTRVAIQPVYFQTGGKGAPRPDPLARVPADDRLFAGDLWLMEIGSSSVNLVVDGAAGSGSVVVPVPALATARRTMEAGIGTALAVLGLVLCAGMVGLVRAANLDAVLPPGAEAEAKHRRRASWITVGTALMVAFAMYAGGRWWGAIDSNYLTRIYRPTELRTAAPVVDGQRRLQLTLLEPEWTDRNAGDLLPDHGKLMHAFLIGEPGRDSFAHIHPVRREADTFEFVAPALPAGRYRVLADIVRETGLAETLVGEVVLPAPGPGDGSGADPDDSHHVGAARTEATYPLPDGSSVVWEQRETYRAGSLHSLRFSVRGPDGVPAALEPYMGMVGHAAILRDDGSVFVHVHPVGTVSMAAQEAFAKRVGGAAPMDHSAHHAHAATHVSFPYAFPRSGRYNVWVQMKHAGRVATGAFAVTVE